MSGASTTKRLTRRVARWVLRLALLVFALVVAAAIVVVVVIPRMTQGAALSVLTGSMTPDIPVGSLVLIRPVDPRTLEVGDVATYQVEPGREAFITHRIVEVHDDPEGLSFTFKGDANPGPDLDPIASGAVRGEVWFDVPYLGAIRDGLHGKGGITLLLMILLGGYAVSQLTGGLRDRRRRSEASPDGPEPGLIIQRTLVLAELHRRVGMAPEDLARQWSALLLHSDDATYTLLIAPPDDGVGAALELLESQRPVRVQVWDAPTTLAGASRSPKQPYPADMKVDRAHD